jgi:hypothetical protein
MICDNTTATAGTTRSSPQLQPLSYYNQVYTKLQRYSTSRFSMHRIRRPHPQCHYDAGRTATRDDDPLNPSATSHPSRRSDCRHGSGSRLHCRLLWILLSRCVYIRRTFLKIIRRMSVAEIVPFVHIISEQKMFCCGLTMSMEALQSKTAY